MGKKNKKKLDSNEKILSINTKPKKSKKYIKEYVYKNEIRAHEAFYAELELEFEKTIEKLETMNPIIFNNCVESMKNKFKIIVGATKNEELVEEMWKHFFTTTIVKVRTIVFQNPNWKVIMHEHEMRTNPIYKKNNYVLYDPSGNKKENSYYNSWRYYNSTNLNIDFWDQFEESNKKYLNNEIVGSIDDNLKTSLIFIWEGFEDCKDKREAFNKFCNEFHPDKKNSDGDFFKEKFSIIRKLLL